MNELCFQFDYPGVELVYVVRIHWALNRVSGRGVDLVDGAGRGERPLDEDGGGDSRRTWLGQQGGDITL